MPSAAVVRRVFVAALLLALLALLLGPVPCVHAQSGSPAAAAAAAPAGTRIGAGERADGGLAFRPPAGWMEITNTALLQGAACAYAGPVVQGFAANVNLVVEKAPAGGAAAALPADLPEQLAEQMRRALPSYRFLGKTRLKIGGKEALSMTGAFRVPQTGQSVRNRQILIVQDGRFYTFTFTASAAAFARAEGAFERMLRTVRWLSSQP